MPSGFVTINAGAIGANSNEARVSITGQGTILASSLVEAWVAPVATVEHSVDEHIVENLEALAFNIVAGTGFDIILRCLNGRLYGNWTVDWAWA